MKILFEVLDEYISRELDSIKHRISWLSKNIYKNNRFNNDIAAKIVVEYDRLKTIENNYNTIKHLCRQIQNAL